MKWVLHGSIVWWNATILRMDEPNDTDTLRRGEIIYHKLDNYHRERASVVLKFNPSTSERSLCALNDEGELMVHENSSSSWIFEDEPVPEESVSTSSRSSQGSHDESTRHHIVDHSQRNQQHTPVHRSRPLPLLRSASQIKKGSSARRTASSSSSFLDFTVVPAQLIPSSSQGLNESKQTSVLRSRRRVANRRENRSMKVSPFSVQCAELNSKHPPANRQQSQPNDCTEGERATVQIADDKSPQTDNFKLEAHIEKLTVKLNLLERQVSHFMCDTSTPSMPSSTLVILLGLKWSLMRRLERPLKEVSFEGGSSFGLSAGSITLKCDCDHRALRDISAFVAWRHSLKNDSNDPTTPATPRTMFLPNVNRAMGPSLGTDNISITFTVFSDLTDLLGVNDEDDFERMIFKEAKGANSHVVQVLGCLETVGSKTSEYDKCSHSTCSNVSVQTSSAQTTPFFRLFIGTAPHSLLADKILAQDVETTSKDKIPYSDAKITTFSSVLFEQPLQNFCMERNCYRAKWRARLVTTSFEPTKQTIGASKEPDKLRSFFLKWTRMKSPSLTKWTSDSQTLTHTVPGQLHLHVPVVYSSSKSNAISISKLVDNHVETFMDQRISIQKSHESRPSQP